ncbi:hypothetical protein [Paraglaciecola chathamensis]|uniref:hypothetical protein n=1 Tax=Paraglaciecola chathamensis TaxID=368405 RepID=UPI0026FBC644|nr:hypothetical protein [Paraglaciecola chathamensis]MDO6559754.1 hypothetical protein [Paraglaciecola chathamensis]
MKTKTLLTFIFSLFLFVLCGCANQPLLRANFDDTVGTFPDLTLAGDPAGDEITWTGSTANSSASLAPLKVINDLNGESGDKILRLFYHMSEQPIAPYLGFHARPTTETNNIYSVLWDGVVEYPGNRNSQRLWIEFYESVQWHTRSLIKLSIQRATDGPGQDWSSVTIYERGGTSRQIGFIRNNLPHAGLVILNLETYKYSLLFGGVTATGDLAPDTNINRLSLYFHYDTQDVQGSSPGLGSYFIDDVKMLLSIPDED